MTARRANADSFRFARAWLLIRRDLLMMRSKMLLYLPLSCIYFFLAVYFFIDLQDRGFVLGIFFSYYVLFRIPYSSLTSGEGEEVLTCIRMPMARLEIFAVDIFYFLVAIPVFLFVCFFFLFFMPLQQEQVWRLIVWGVSYFPLSGFWVWFYRGSTKNLIFFRFRWQELMMKEEFFVILFFAFVPFVAFFMLGGGVPEIIVPIYSIFALMLTATFWVVAYRKDVTVTC